MATTYDLGLVLDFLDELSRHNQKAWFEEHRRAYEAARDAFYGFVDTLIDEFRALDRLEGLSAKDCVPRIYRDIRFSKGTTQSRRLYADTAGKVAPDWRTQRLGRGAFHAGGRARILTME